MPRIAPPPGTVERKVAVRVLLRERVISSPAMLAKLRGIERIQLKGRTHGFYSENQLLEIINDRRRVYGLPELKNIYEEEHHIVFRQAKPEDMPAVYLVAEKLFGHTTSAENRIPLIEKVPEGNFVVVDNDEIVSFAHVQPLKREPLQNFLSGEIRGKDIIADYLDPFAPGKIVDILIKSLGSYHDNSNIRKRYSKALFIGMRHELVKWGEKGYIIHRIYATSETQSGIEAAVEFNGMISLGKIPGTKGKKRFAFEIDPLTSTHPILRDYQIALKEWSIMHPVEYQNAWEIWKKKWLSL